MDFLFVDYSGCISAAGASADCPPESYGKFIQVRNSRSEYLVCALTTAMPYHANIAERFFSTQGVPGRFNAKRDFFEVADSGWTVVGGGVWRLTAQEQTLTLSGSSQAYGRFEARGLQENIRRAPGMERLRIIVAEQFTTR
ncbi:MAG: hypothetical protein OHK006_22080 [Thermodesulfovibrionales bacterium]